jgi:MFS transporter, PAT family, beta-lactamase induction signal transducer AmpG
MGLANLPFGLYGGAALITVPQLLAARHVPEPTIAAITAAAMIPTVCGFLIAPILDVRFNRRSYALVFGALTALMAWVGLVRLDSTGVLTACLVTGFLFANLFYNALGGWLGDLVPSGEEGRLGATFTIGNVAGFGIAAILFMTLIRGLSPAWGPPAVAATIASPLLLLIIVPVSSAERRSARESFGTLLRDLGQLLRNRTVLRALLLFSLPASSFALTNILGAVGAEFGASERFVAVLAGTGVTAAAIIGALVVPAIVKRVPPLLLYLVIGSGGALFTLLLILLPRVPAVFALAMVCENVFQSAAFAVEATIIFRTIGEDNPLASTQFGLLQAATAFPITYMQAVDGQGYGVGGLSGGLLTDAALSLLACAVLLPLVLSWMRRDRVRSPAQTTA